MLRRFSVQVLIWLGGIALLAILLHLGDYAHRERAQIERNYATGLTAYAKSLAAALDAPLAAADPAAVARLIDALPGFPGVRRLAVSGADGRLLHGVGAATPKAVAGEAAAALETFAAPAARTLSVREELAGGGALELTADLSRLDSAHRQHDVRSASMMLLAFALGAALLLLFLRRTTKALQQATRFAAELGDSAGATMPETGDSIEIRRLVAALNAASRRLYGQEKTIAASQRFLHGMAEALGEGVIASDAEGRCTFINPEAERLLQWQSAAIVGRPVHDCIHFQTVNGTLIEGDECPLHASHMRRHVFRSDLEVFTRRDGSLLPVTAVSIPLFAGDEFSGTVLAFQDISERRRSEEYLLATSSRLSALIENLQAGVLLEDEDGAVVTANRVLGAIFDLPQPNSALLGQPALPLLAECGAAAADPAGFARQIAALQAARQPATGVEIRLADQRVLELDYLPIYLFPAMPQPEDYRGHLWLFRDVSAKKEIESELLRARQAAEDASAAKSAFLANISHEIRTPLNGVIGMTELVLDGALAAEQRSHLETVRSSAQTLLLIINDILDFSRIEAGRLSIESLPFDLRQTVADCVRPLALRADRQGLAFACEVAPEVPAELVGDPLRLRQVLVNLIGNALKFTERGSIELRVRVVERSAQRVRLQFAVSDSGIGIAAADQAAIFDSFAQADSTITRRFGGTGLGLAICRQLLDLMDGEISVASQPGKGSTFTFSLPFAVGAAPPAAESAASGLPQLPPLKLLLAEDNPVNQELAGAIFRRDGHRVRTCANGAAALAALAEEDFDLLLLDLQMPVMGGFEVVRRVRQAEAASGRHLPIVAMTASAMRGDRERCLAAGMDGYVAKPLAQPALYAEIARCLPVPPAPSSALPATPDPAPPAASADAAARQEARRAAIARLGGDEAIYRAAVAMFVRDAANYQAELAAAAADSHSERLQRAAHIAKGLLATFAGAAAAELAREIEFAASDGLASAAQRVPELIAVLADLAAHLRAAEGLAAPPAALPE